MAMAAQNEAEGDLLRGEKKHERSDSMRTDRYPRQAATVFPIRSVIARLLHRRRWNHWPGCRIASTNPLPEFVEP